jgi:hypothetical protein
VIALATAILDRDQWRSTLDGWTSDHVGDEVTIEVLDPSVGHQYEAEKLPFSYRSRPSGSSTGTAPPPS